MYIPQTSIYLEPEHVSCSSMYQLFFRTTDLVLLLYPALFIKSMTFSLATQFYIHFLVYELQGS